MHGKAQRVLPTCLALLAASAAMAAACSVPVFRYALERWPPDRFQATVFHRGPLTPAQSRVVATLESSPANLEVAAVDLETEKDPERLETWEEQQSDTLPWLYVTYPESHPVAVELAAGPLEENFAREILDTPVRQDLSQQLALGQTAIWVLLESGDQTRDDAAWELLSAELARLQSTLELPAIKDEDIAQGLISVSEDDLKIAFSSIRLSRDEPAEEMFVRMLLDAEEDLLDSEEPMVFPIFGRGRLLYGLVGDGIAPGTLQLAASYLVGACSCQVKAENPGVDLLLATDWDDLVESTLDTDRPLPDLAGILPHPLASGSASTTAAIASSDARVIPTVAQAPTTAGGDRSQMLWTTLAALGSMFLLVALGSALRRTKKV